MLPVGVQPAYINILIKQFTCVSVAHQCCTCNKHVFYFQIYCSVSICALSPQPYLNKSQQCEADIFLNTLCFVLFTESLLPVQPDWLSDCSWQILKECLSRDQLVRHDELGWSEITF